MHRIVRILFAGFLAVLVIKSAPGDVRNPGSVELDRARLRVATPGQPYAGVVVVTSPQEGVLETVTIRGAGWQDISVEWPAKLDVQAGEVIRIPFQAAAAGDTGRIDVRVVVGGSAIGRTFDVSPERIAEAAMPYESEWVGPTGVIRGGVDGAESRGCSDQIIRVHGRIQYTRSDGQVIGADHIRYQIWDEDVFDSELMFEGQTDEQGNYDVTLCWDDCDALGCDDPDIYLVYRVENDVAAVRAGSFPNNVYAFSTQNSLIFDDFTGNDVDFGVQTPPDPTLHAALQMLNSITRAHRYVVENAGYSAPLVDVWWQTVNGAFYSNSNVRINIGPDEQWNEGTQVHEWGHHLLYQWTAPVAPSYCNGYCDDSIAGNCGPGEPCIAGGGHCIWCAETPTDAWNEGFPDWLGSVVLRIWQARYGGPLPTAIADSRYTLETAANCCDGTTHGALTTEGFVAALLRDVEDPPRDPGQTVCPQDSLGLGGDEILHVVQTYAPIRVSEFIDGFRSEYPEFEQDFRSTAEAVSPTYIAGWAAPSIDVLSTIGCGTYHTGETITLSVQTNASRYSTCMRWQRGGVDLADGGRVSGATTETLQITNAAGADAGSYSLRISSCDGPAGARCNGTQSTTSPPIAVRIISTSAPSSVVTGWGRNTFGMLGRGTDQPDFDVNPGQVSNLGNITKVSAGYWNCAALRSDGTVWTWGAGILGNGTSNSSSSPVQVNGLTDVVAVHTDGIDRTMIALDADGHVWTWGSGFYGQLGYSQPSGYALNPGQVSGLDCVVDVSIGWTSAAAVTSDGTLWTWGTNYNGQLGLGTVGGVYPTPQRVSDLTDVVDVECGGVHILARRTDGTIWAAGYNTQGQLGDGTLADRSHFTQTVNMPDAIAISAGGLHSLAVRADGSAWGWGSNGSGELGVGIGTSWNPAPLAIPVPGPVRAVDAGYTISLFVDGEGTIWTCGYNGYGALGRPTQGNGFATVMPVDTRVGASLAASAGSWHMITVAPGARITAPVPDQLAAGCARVQLSVQTAGVPPLSYLWRRNGVPLTDGGRIAGVATPTLTIDPTDDSDTDLYDVVVWNAANLTASNAITLATPGLLNAFDAPQDADWFENERGAWTVTNGAYAAGAPALYANSAYSSFELPQTDFLIELDVVNASALNFDTNGGIYLRSTFTPEFPYPRGVILAFGDSFPFGGGDIYWHRNYGSGYQSAQNVAQSAYTPGQTLHLRIEVRGDTYTAWANDSPTPTTMLVAPDFPAGRIGLLDGVAAGTAFDNIFIQTLPGCGPGVTPPRVTQRPRSRTVAAGASVTLSVTATGDGPLSYQWLHDGSCLPGATAATYRVTAAPDTVGRYECTVSNVCGSVGSYPAFVAIGSVVPGDVDGDGHVDINDLLSLLGALGTCSGDPHYLAAADFNESGCVDMADLAELQVNYGL